MTTTTAAIFTQTPEEVETFFKTFIGKGFVFPKGDTLETFGSICDAMEKIRQKADSLLDHALYHSSYRVQMAQNVFKLVYFDNQRQAVGSVFFTLEEGTREEENGELTPFFAITHINIQ